MSRIHHRNTPTPTPPRQEPPAPPPPPPAPPKPAMTPPRQQSTFEASNRREAALRQWSAQNGGAPAPSLLPAPMTAGGPGIANPPAYLLGMAGGFQTGGVKHSVPANQLQGAGAYAELETRVQKAEDAQAQVERVERKLAEELAIIGPTLTPAERTAYVESFRDEQAAAYAARDAAVADVAAQLETEGANLQAYLVDYHGGSPSTVAGAAQPLMDALKLVADSPHAGTAMDFLDAHGTLLGQVVPAQAQRLEEDVYGPAINATMAHALASGQTPQQAVATVKALIERMPDAAEQRILGSNPEAALGALARVASGDVYAIGDLSRIAGQLDTPGASALVSSALALAMLQNPDSLQSPAFFQSVLEGVSSAADQAEILSGALENLQSVLTTHVGLREGSRVMQGVALGTGLMGGLDPFLGTVDAAFSLMNLLAKEDPNAGTHLQMGAQAVGGILAAGTLMATMAGATVSPVVGTLALSAKLLAKVGEAMEKHLNRLEAAEASRERATQLGLPDVDLRIHLAFNFPTQVRELAIAGIGYERMNEVLSSGFMDTSSVALLAHELQLSPEEASRVLDLVVPPGTTTLPERENFLAFMGFYRQAREANPGGTPEQLVTWMRENRPPPPHGGVGYHFMGSMIDLLASTL